MHNLLSENLISFGDAAKKFPAYRGNGRMHASTFFRWGQIGARAASGERIKLEVIKVGGRFLTSSEALQRFIHRLTATDGPTTPPRTSTAARRDSERAMKRIRRRGVAV